MENPLLMSNKEEDYPEDSDRRIIQENHNNEGFSQNKRGLNYEIEKSEDDEICPQFQTNQKSYEHEYQYQYQSNNDYNSIQHSQISHISTSPSSYQTIQNSNISRSKIIQKYNNNYNYNPFKQQIIINNESKMCEPRDNTSKAKNRSFISTDSTVKIISSKKYVNKSNMNNINQSKKKIPRILSFQKMSSTVREKEKENINTNIILNKINTSELVDVPRAEYGSFAGKDIIFVGRGMETGEYKFKGAKIIMKARANENQKQKIKINEDEIYKEINKRIHNQKKEKKQKIPKYEIINTFCAKTEFDGKPIIKIIKSQQRKMKYEKENINVNFNVNLSKKQRYHSSQKNQNQTIAYNKKWEEPINLQKNKEILKENRSFICRQKKLNNKKFNYRYKTDYSVFPNDKFSITLLNLINKVRTDPQSYIRVLEEEKKKIITDRYGRIIYNGRLKVALNKGEVAFNDAIEFLKNIYPMEELEFNQLITIECPENENDIKNINYVTYKVDNMIKNGIFVNSYWRDIINDPEICFLLLIVDDICYKSGKRRKDILNPNMNYIGISSKEINGKFVCFITLSSSL